jgi:hypothetical protein
LAAEISWKDFQVIWRHDDKSLKRLMPLLRAASLLLPHVVEKLGKMKFPL